MVHTVKKLSRLAGVSVRTLHYYDEIGLLKPSAYGNNGYRYYGEDATLRLQQILFYRELGLCLDDIKDILDDPDFDVLRALQAHRQALQEQTRRLNHLITTIDKTITHLQGKSEMSTQELFEGFSEEKQKQYKQEAATRWGKKTVAESYRRWNNYTMEQKKQIGVESEAIYRDLLTYMDKGPSSPEVQQIIARWHQHLRYFYEPTPEILVGLGHGYNEHPDFIATFKKIHPDLPEFLEQAITYYCEQLLSTD